MGVEEEFEIDDNLADTSSQVSSLFSFSFQLIEARANLFQYRLLQEE